MNRSAIFSPIRYSSPITLFHYQRKKINHMETRWDTWLCCYHPNTGDINMHQETAFWRINWKSMLFKSVSGAPGSHADDAFSCKESSIGIKLSKKLCIMHLVSQRSLVYSKFKRATSFHSDWPRSNAFLLLCNCLKDIYCAKHIWNISH